MTLKDDLFHTNSHQSTPIPEGMDSSDTHAEVSIVRISNDASGEQLDRVAVESPLAIYLEVEGSRPSDEPLACILRTPGSDRDLALGWLVSEGLIRSVTEVLRVRTEPVRGSQLAHVKIFLSADSARDLSRVRSATASMSACGLCGRIDANAFDAPNPPELTFMNSISREILLHLPARLKSAQDVFAHTGGLHAAAWFDETGTLLDHAEDVGRHNAMDKIVGRAFGAAGNWPLSGRGVLWSGRASHELVLKAIMAGIPLAAAIGAPSSAAISLATKYGLTLVGFLSEDRFNVYTGNDRILGSP